MRFGLLCLAVVAVVLPGAAPRADIEDLLRRGNAAFDAGDYAAAVGFYDKAEERATDPGLVAFNKATALYRLAVSDPRDSLKRFRTAEVYYRAAAASADEPRRSRALFGLANSLLQARGEEVAALREAIRCYRACLSSPDADASLAEDARHNLELAKVLWVKALAKNPNADQDKKNDTEEGKSSQEPMGQEPAQMPGGNEAGNDPNRMGAGQQSAEASGQQPVQTQRTAPGSGSLPPVEDSDRPTPLTPEEASEHLKNAVQRILDDRRSQRFRSSRTPAGPVKDW
jgi:tetratricopeptide (TPR) repeat protein